MVTPDTQVLCVALTHTHTLALGQRKLGDVPYTPWVKQTDAERMTEQMLNVVPRQGPHQL